MVLTFKSYVYSIPEPRKYLCTPQKGAKIEIPQQYWFCFYCHCLLAPRVHITDAFLHRKKSLEFFLYSLRRLHNIQCKNNFVAVDDFYFFFQQVKVQLNRFCKDMTFFLFRYVFLFEAFSPVMRCLLYWMFVILYG